MSEDKFHDHGYFVDGGQCDDKQPSAEWHAAADAAICVVAHQEYPQLAPPHRKCGLKELYRSADQ